MGRLFPDLWAGAHMIFDMITEPCTDFQNQVLAIGMAVCFNMGT